MSALLEKVQKDIVELHDFFTEWFNGTAAADQLDDQVLSRLHPDFTFVSPEGTLMTRDHLAVGLREAHGSNSDFRIQIHDVIVRYEMGNRVLATYTEWQTGARQSGEANNARFSTVLMEVGNPVTWLHLQETWLPEDIRAAGNFDF